ncbi:MAG: hypothetical protein Q8K60_09780 [Parachlamydiaceae bacterium]|nr:hypothetical protein [Parachlamydiaceae bacterium]
MLFQKLSLSFLFVFSSVSLISELNEEKHVDVDHQRIRVLDQELKVNEQLEMEKLVHSRDYMIANWPKYSQEIQEIHQLDLEDKKKEKQIEQLKSSDDV